MRKIRLQGIKLLRSRPLRNGKITFYALESLNSDVRDKSQAEITMLGQDDHETDTKKRTLTNSDYELMNPLEMVKKTNSGF